MMAPSVKGQVDIRMRVNLQVHRQAWEQEPPFKLPLNGPLSSASTGSREEAQLKVCLTRLKLKSIGKAQQRQPHLQYQLENKNLEIKAELKV